MDAVPAADQIGGGPLPAHVCGHDVHTTVGVGVAQVLARLRNRLAGIHRVARAYDGATVAFPDDPFPAMVCPERESLALKRYLGLDRVVTLHAALPFKGEDFALFLDRIPGTYAFLGVRTPGAGIETSYPHLATFTPDERAIGHGVRAMAGWLARRTR
jgi:metal-dependent amidase/aminoacylase/carboxypeptidase family protein